MGPGFRQVSKILRILALKLSEKKKAKLQTPCPPCLVCAGRWVSRFFRSPINFPTSLLDTQALPLWYGEVELNLLARVESPKMRLGDFGSAPLMMRFDVSKLSACSDEP